MEHMPDDVLYIIFKYIMPRMLYYGDVSCVCKRWHSLMKSVPMINFLRIQRWPSYAALELHPRTHAIASIHANVLITTGDDGAVYTLFQESVHRWCVLRGTKVLWEIDKHWISLRAPTCPTFAVVGTTMYIRCEAGVAVYRDGKPVDIISYQYGVRKIILANGKVYVLHDDGVHVIDGKDSKRITWLKGTNWRDMAVDGDFLYGATHQHLQKWDKGRITDITGVDGPTGIIDMYDGRLYCVDQSSAVYALIAGEMQRVVLYVGINAYAVVGEIICIAIEHAILGFYMKGGEPFRISCPHVQNIWGAAGKLYAVDRNGNILKYI